ncbi:hypothetical protein EYF80_002961 [Liparis tanakae]|uniref:Uncharacterized protein n=1 Tax=Liparis tanakae TaxID=230148 RepID=A0A4Z2JAU6_9TELE|nr:hypothetical protein EYF80_002961 [Liparis tanakae]
MTVPWMRSGWDVLFQPLVISGSSEQVSFLATSVDVGAVAVHTPPVIILRQSHLLKVNVEPVAFGGLQDPVARSPPELKLIETGERNRIDRKADK